MTRIVITTTSFGEYDNSCIELCKKKGVDVVINPYRRKIKQEELIELAKDAVGLIAGTESITKDVFRKLRYLKVISRCGVGIDNIDLKTAKEFGIKVFNTPDAPTLAVAELTIGLILNLLRKITEMNREMRNCLWRKKMGNLLSDKKIGIIGFGNIGRKIAQLLVPFGCEIAYCDPFVEKDLFGFKQLSKEDLLKWSDIVSIHASVKHMILEEKELRLMKKGSWLINVARGGIIDENGLYKLLKEGHLCGAALDVFELEPYKGNLTKLNNVILTPHIGSYAKEARIKMEKEAVKNLLKGLNIKRKIRNKTIDR